MKGLIRFFKSTSWGDHTIQFFIVLLSITIAFNLEGYRQNVNDRKEELENLHSLLVELEEDIDFFNSLTKHNQNKLEILEDFQNNQYKSLTAGDQRITALQSVTFKDDRFAPMDITYTSMMSAGKLGSISNREIRSKMIALYHRLYRVVYDEQRLYNEQVKYSRNARVEAYTFDEESNSLIFKEPSFNEFLKDEHLVIQERINFYSICLRKCQELQALIKNEVEK